MSETVNGFEMALLRGFVAAVGADRSQSERNPVLTAHWEGGSRARIQFGEVVTHIGGDDELNSMQAVLAAIAACDVEVIAIHAALMGIEIEDLAIEARGHFNVASYVGYDDDPGPGYDGIEYTVRLRAPGITEDQIAELRHRCEVSSPVGDTLTRSVPLRFDFEVT